jgi:ketosteroid isomerase-like protein
VLLAPGLQAQTAPDAAALTSLLKEFLAGASRNDVATHERFWADDLVYTRSAGKRTSKAEILKDLRARPAPSPGEPSTSYTGEDVQVRQFGDMAVVTFRLVGTTERNGRPETTNYLNTGVFRKRAGTWQAVAWQATRAPWEDEQARKDAAAAQVALVRAFASADAKAAESLVDEGFLWTRPGAQWTRTRLLDEVRTGALKGVEADPSATITIYGDTAVVHGVGHVPRPPAPGSSEGATAVGVDYTLTLGNKGDGWKVVALHSNRAAGN